MRKRTTATIAAILLSACGGDGEAGNGAVRPSPVATRPSSTAKLAIVEPESGAVVDGTVARVRLVLTGAELSKEVSRELHEDQGHIHIRLDGRTLTLLGDLDESLVDLLGEPLSPGPHLLEAEFVAADHGLFDPRVVASVPFTVK